MIKKLSNNSINKNTSVKSQGHQIQAQVFSIHQHVATSQYFEAYESVIYDKQSNPAKKSI